MATLRELQDLYGQQDKQFTYYTDPSDASKYFLSVPGTDYLNTGYFNIDQGTLDLLDQNNLVQGGAQRGTGAGGISWEAFSDPILGNYTGGTYSQSGGMGTPGVNYTDAYYSQTQQTVARQQEEQRVQQLNQAIASGDTATVERLQPGYTLWNGAFVQSSSVPQLQSSGSTVQDGNVVGPDVAGLGGVAGTPAQLTSLPGYTDPNASGATYTPPGTGNANNTVYKDLQGNIFKLDGTPIDQKTFQDMGLNVSQINTKQQLDSRTGGQQEADNAYSGGGMTTGRTPGEQTDFMKAMTDRLSKIDSLVADIASSVQPSAEEKGVSESLNKMTESFELGMVDIEGQTSPMKAIIGQQAQLERRAGVKIKALQNKLKLLGDDREAKGKALEVAYNASRQGVSDAIKLYEMTQPDRIAFDSKTGTVFFQNPMTGEVYQEKIPGFVPSADPTALEEEYNALKKGGYTGSLLDYVQWKATQFGTEKSGTTGEEEKKKADFRKDLTGWNLSGTREQFIRQLTARYKDDFDPKQISDWVYTTYPDGYNNQ